jgi:hypothetical protein
MKEYLQAALGIVSVEEKDDVITVIGSNGKSIQKVIHKFYKTSRVSNNIFINVSRVSFSFHSFFLPDILFIINELIVNRAYGVPIRTLNKIRDKLLKNTWIKDCEDRPVKQLDRSLLDDLIFKPLDFQEEFFKIYEENTSKYNLKGYLFGAGAGGGKTYSSLALTHLLKSKQIIIVSPINAVNAVWEKNINTVFKPHVKRDYWISTSGKPFTGKEKYIIVHYEWLSKLFHNLILIEKKGLSIILDESHNLNELTSMRTEVFINICKKTNCQNTILLSGTPIKAMSVESIPLLRCIDPLFTPEVEKQFRAIFRGDTTKAVSILNNRLNMVSLIVPKERFKLLEPVLKNITINFKGSEKYTLEAIKLQMKDYITKRVIYYQSRKETDHKKFYAILRIHEEYLNTEKDKQEYKDYLMDLNFIIKNPGSRELSAAINATNSYEKNEILPNLSNEDKLVFKEVKTIVKYVHLKIQGECLGNVVSRARINCHVDMVKHIDFFNICESTDKKTVVFTSFTEVIFEANRFLINEGFKPLLVYAETNKQLTTIIDKFENNEIYNPLVATYASLSTAVPLTMADVMIIIDPPFRDYILNQAISRIHRIGADTAVTVYSIMLNTDNKPNISTRTLDILSWSQSEIDKIIGIKSPYVLTAGDTDINIATENFNQFLGIDEYTLNNKSKIYNW